MSNGTISISYVSPPPPPINFSGSMDISGGEFSSAGNQITTFIQVQGGSTQTGSFSIESSQQNVSLNGQTFATKDWSCTASVSAFSIPPPYAVNQAAVTLSQVNGLWAIQSLMSLATLPVSGVSVVWNIALVLVPKGLAGGSQIGAEAPPLVSSSGFALNIPFTLMSSITGSTMTIKASENLALLAELPVPVFLGTGNVVINANNNIDLMANFDITLGADHDIDMTASSTINITAYTTILSNTTDCDLYGGCNSRVRLYAPNINIEDTIGNIINFGSNVYDSFTNIGDQRVKYGTVSGSNIMDVTNITGHINLNASSNNIILTGQNFTLIDPVSGGSGNLTVDSNSSLYWNGTFIA